MSTEVFKDALLTIGGVDLSDHIKSVSLNYAAEDIDDTNMGDDTRVHKGGLKDWSVDVEFSQDFDVAKVDATLWPLLGADAVALVLRKSKTDAVAATNPQFTGNAVLLSYPPLGGGVGELHKTSIKFHAGGDLARATS